MDQFKAKFMEEAEDLLAALEKALLTLERDPASGVAIEEVFRVMHTLKGNSTMFGFEYMGEFTHHLETIFDHIRQGKQKVSTAVLDISLASVDHLRLLLEDENLQGSGKQRRHQEMLNRVLTLNNDLAVAPSGETALTEERRVGQVNTFHVQFIPHADLLKNGSNPLYLIDELHALGKCQAFPRTAALPGLAEMDATSCYTAWDILLATGADVSEIQDVFLFVEDEAIVKVNSLAEEDIFERENIEVITEQLKAAEEVLPPEKMRELIPVAQKEASLPEPEQLATAQRISSIRVPSDKLDKLMNLVSELVTTQARLSLFADQQGQAALTAIAEEMEKISRRLRDDTFSISLIPIEHLFTRFQRLVRDLSQQLHKDIHFVTEGGETELDKSIIENITDPLLHMLRNSIDHGIEGAEDRLRAKKPAQGKIVLRAFYSGAYVNIRISDDGAGINPEKIKAKAVSKGLVPADAPLSETEIFDLLFLPGFSTAAQVTEVSGRGVGMDVVKRKITDMRGDIQIASTLGEGTNITIRLPLTLSVIDGLLVKIADTHYVIPLSVVNRCYEIKRGQLENSLNESVLLDGELVPFLDLKGKLNEQVADETGEEGRPQYEYVIQIGHNNTKVGIVADAIIGEHQAVLKPLGKVYKQQDFVSGATILGDGTIALVMDTNKMVDKFSIQSIKHRDISYEKH